MAGRIRREDIDAVRERARIEDVVGEHVTLKSAGVGSMKGLCPFHDERTPSFHVRPQLGLWHCFGCGEGGDVISFIQKVNHLPFTEAVESLAGRVGVQLRYEDGGGPSRPGVEPGTRQRLLDANRLAEAYYREQLAVPAAQTGRDFLTGRGFDRRAAEHFGIGYAPPGWDNLARHLRGAGYTEPELVASGLCSQGGAGGSRVYDRFRDRLVWPIRDVTGATVGFGARRLADGEGGQDVGPKYLNTPETAIYKKGQVLYGLDLAKKDIARTHKVVVVEGYTDVMAAHLSGVTTAVATCGTAFGEGHVRIVRRLLGDTADPAAGVLLAGGSQARGGEVVFIFDGDAAGQKAALRAFGEDQHFAAQTFVAVEPTGKDPCELWVAEGPDAIAALVDSRKPLFEFVIRAALSSLDLATAEGRVSGLRAAAPVVAGIRDRALRREYTRSLSGWLGMREAEVADAVQRAERSGRAVAGSGSSGGAHRWEEPGRAEAARRGSWHQGPDGPVPGAGASSSTRVGGPGGGATPRGADPVARLERQALEVIVQMPQVALGAGVDDLDPGAFSQPVHRAVFEALQAAGGVGAFGARMEQLRGQGTSPAALEQRAAAWWIEEVRAGVAGPVDAALTELAVAPLPVPEGAVEAAGAYARGVLLSMTLMGHTHRLAELRRRQRRMQPGDEGYREVFEQIVALENRRRALREAQTA